MGVQRPGAVHAPQPPRRRRSAGSHPARSAASTYARPGTAPGRGPRRDSVHRGTGSPASVTPACPPPGSGRPAHSAAIRSLPVRSPLAAAPHLEGIRTWPVPRCLRRHRHSCLGHSCIQLAGQPGTMRQHDRAQRVGASCRRERRVLVTVQHSHRCPVTGHWRRRPGGQPNSTVRPCFSMMRSRRPRETRRISAVRDLCPAVLARTCWT
jgi:hypothetical protein